MPHYLSGRRLILFVQSLVYPLQKLNDRFREFAREKLIEAAMTSQVGYFEWYLTRKFREYFEDPEEGIYIKETQTVGVDLYREHSLTGRPYTLWMQGEQVVTDDPQEQPREFYYLAEEKAIRRVSFVICVPAITIPENEFVYLLSWVVNNYKIAGKTYLIKIDSKEIAPVNKTNLS